MLTHFFIIIYVEMKIQQRIVEIKRVITPLLGSQNVELVDVELKGAIGNHVLRIYVDVVGGINLDLCVKLSREISDILDIEDILPGKYRLEVSSPGIYRSLKTKDDFRRNEGRQVALNLVDGNRIEGCLKKVINSDVYIEIENDQIKYPLSSIKLAKLILKW